MTISDDEVVAGRRRTLADEEELGAVEAAAQADVEEAIARALRSTVGQKVDRHRRERAPSATSRRARHGYLRATMVAIVVLPILGALAGLVFTLTAQPSYTAHAYLLLTNATKGADASAVNVAQATARIATNPSVVTAGAGDNTLNAAAQRGDLAATASPDLPLIDLAATASSASASALLANQFADRVKQHLADFPDLADVRVGIFAAASDPTRPTSPNLLVDVGAGAAFGALLAGLLYLLRRS
jgi:capsular polysaccharide biosynthesis protein